MPITLNTDKLGTDLMKEKGANQKNPVNINKNAGYENTAYNDTVYNNAAFKDTVYNDTVYFDEIIILSDHKTTSDEIAKNTLKDLKKSAQKYSTHKNSALKIQHFESASDAIYHILTQKDLKNHYVALLLCDYVLDDFDAGLIISLLRLHPLGELFPVIVTLNTDLVDEHHREFWLSKNCWDDEAFWENEKLSLRTLGAVGFLEYPYTLQEVLECSNTVIERIAGIEKNYYQNIIDLGNADSKERTEAESKTKEQLKNFEEGFVRFFYTPDETASFEEIFLVGKQKYYDRLYKQATKCFEQSSDQESVHQADSLAYLYAIHKEQRKQHTAKIYLERAFNAYVFDENWDKVRESANIFAKEFPDQKNPVFSAMQKNYAHFNYQTINKLVEYTKDIVPLQEIGEHLVQLNGSKKLPPIITEYVEKDRELTEIVFKSNLKDTVLDGEEYIKQQEKEKALKRLELQWKSRVSGEVSDNTLKEKYVAHTSVLQGYIKEKAEEKAREAQKNALPKNQFNFRASSDMDDKINVLKGSEKSAKKKMIEKSDHYAQNKLRNFMEEERQAKIREQARLEQERMLENSLKARAEARQEAEAKARNELENKLQSKSRVSDNEPADNFADNAEEKKEKLLLQASKIGTKSKTQIDPIPTIMLNGGNGSFWDDILNMAKFTKFISRNKKKK